MQISRVTSLCSSLLSGIPTQFPGTSTDLNLQCFLSPAKLASILGSSRLWNPLLREPGNLGTASGYLVREVSDMQNETCCSLCPPRSSWGNKFPAPQEPLAEFCIHRPSKSENATRGQCQEKWRIGGALAPPLSPLNTCQTPAGIL